MILYKRSIVMAKLFGTDGIRGIVNRKLTGELAYLIGKCGSKVLHEKNPLRNVIIVGTDTRISSPMIEHSICAGIASYGINVIKLGDVPTPAIGYLIQKFDLLGGVMISASHNPYEYNGIKFFDSNGIKLSDDIENEIEDTYFSLQNGTLGIESLGIGSIKYADDMVDEYINFLLDNLDGVSLDGLRIAIDCANGAAYSICEKVFKNTNAEIIFLNNTPNGININNKCGSTYMDFISKFVVENKCDMGFAYDGDADRCLAVDHEGNIIDGDSIMGIIAIYFKNKGMLNKNTIVATVMSNIGLYKSLDRYGILVSRVSVGDKYVFEDMYKNNYVVGGEQSGHIILLDNKTGDGILTSIIISKIVKESNSTLKEISSIIKKFPQILINVEASDIFKTIYKNDEEIRSLIKYYEEILADKGRILVRESGTEDLIRIMIEGENIEVIKEIGEDISNIIRSKIKNV